MVGTCSRQHKKESSVPSELSYRTQMIRSLLLLGHIWGRPCFFVVVLHLLTFSFSTASWRTQLNHDMWCKDKDPFKNLAKGMFGRTPAGAGVRVDLTPFAGDGRQLEVAFRAATAER